jgi:hypothetical protein
MISGDIETNSAVFGIVPGQRGMYEEGSVKLSIE